MTAAGEEFSGAGSGRPERVVLGLGSNRSFGGLSPVRLLKAATLRLESFISGLRSSSVYRTAPLYEERQADFYNTVVLGFFDGSPRDLLRNINETEALFGRDRLKEKRNGPRSMDIDIELFGSKTLRESSLVIPHERLLERAFVLKPLVEVLRGFADIYKDEADYYEKRLVMCAGQRVELEGRLTGVP